MAKKLHKTLKCTVFEVKYFLRARTLVIVIKENEYADMIGAINLALETDKEVTKVIVLSGEETQIYRKSDHVWSVN